MQRSVMADLQPEPADESLDGPKSWLDILYAGIVLKEVDGLKVGRCVCELAYFECCVERKKIQFAAIRSRFEQLPRDGFTSDLTKYANAQWAQFCRIEKPVKGIALQCFDVRPKPSWPGDWEKCVIWLPLEAFGTESKKRIFACFEWMAGEHASVISGRYNDLFNPDKLLSELNEMLNRLATQLRVKYEPTKQSRIISLKVAIVSEGGKYEALKERLIAMSDSDDSRRIESQLRLIQGRLAPLQGELQNLLNPPTEPPRR